MTINADFIKQLRIKAHSLKPVVIIGQHGLTQAVQGAIARALYDHELIKIKVHGADKEARQTIADEICQAQQAELVQMIGHTVSVYRPSKKHKGGWWC